MANQRFERSYEDEPAGYVAPDDTMPEDDEFTDDRSSEVSLDEMEAMRSIAETDPDLLTEEEAEELGLNDTLQPGPAGFDENIAEYLDDGYLGRLAQDVVQWVDEDKEARKEWQEREASGIRLLGVTERVEGGAKFEGASKAVHPMLTMAVLQFQSRAIEEIWPSGGPAKAVVAGATNEEREAQAQRVQGFMNYQYTKMMPGGFDETDRLLMRLPLSGSCFKRVYYDPVRETVVSRFAEPGNVYVPYAATDLETVPRFTFEFEETQRETRQQQLSGQYLDDVPLLDPEDPGDDRTDVDEAIDDADGASPVTGYDESGTYKRYECACFLDLPGFEDLDEWGEPTGLALPYLVTVDKDSQIVLRVARNWRPDDGLYRRRVHLIHYKFTPGFGFYGYGLVHLSGGLGRAATGALRSLLDAAYLANMRGGFVSRDARMGKAVAKIEQGKWTEVDADPETLAKAFHEFQYREPSKAMVELLGTLQTLGDRVSSTTENLVGDGNTNAPVGTTLAVIEQGLKIITAVHKRLHEAQTKELSLVAELTGEYLPERYPYAVEGAEEEIFAADFDERVDVLAVSDPNAVTNTQRIAQQQAVLQLAAEAPDLYNRRAVHRRMLEVMRVDGIDNLMAEEEGVPRQDPVAENMALLQGMPVQAFIDQNHEAHIAVLEQFIVQMSQMESLPEQFMPAAQAHLSQHVAMAYQVAVMQQLGMDLPPQGEEVDPETDAQIAQAVAVMPAVNVPVAGLGTAVNESGDGAAAGDGAKTQAQIEREDAKAAADIKRKDAVSAADIRRKNAAAGAGTPSEVVEEQSVDEIANSLLEEARTRRALTQQRYGGTQPNQAPSLAGIEAA